MSKLLTPSRLAGASLLSAGQQSKSPHYRPDPDPDTADRAFPIYPPYGTDFSVGQNVVAREGMLASETLAADEGELLPRGRQIQLTAGTPGFVLLADRGQSALVIFSPAPRQVAYAFCEDDELATPDEFAALEQSGALD